MTLQNQSKGKTAKALMLSRQIRAEFLFKMGIKEVPSSILYHDRSDVSMDSIITGGRSYTKAMKDELSSIKGDTLKRVFTSAGKSVGKGRRYKSYSLGYKTEDSRMRGVFDMSGMSCRAGGLSRFSQNVGRLLVRFFCPENGIVCDLFAGHNSRMELVYTLGRNYIGIDISKEFMEANRRIKSKLEEKEGFFQNKSTIRLIEGDSSSVNLPDNYADFSITSPPYWDLEWYGDEKEQLGNAKTYELFLDLLFKHVAENHRILKPGSFCAWFINDFTKEKQFFPYHIDVSLLFRKAGFILHNICIVDLGQPIAAAFIRTLLNSKRFPKRHEYCIIGQKKGINQDVEDHIKQLGGNYEGE